MLPTNPDRDIRGALAAIRRRFGGRAAAAGLTAALAILALGSALTAQRITSRGTAQDTVRTNPTEPPGDLRCLTRRAGDCLEEPVPADEPHGAVCATCHTMWERGESPGGSVKACTAAGCHERADTLSPFHLTVSAATLDDCTSCHVSHSFRVPPQQAGCAVCHPSGGKPAVQAHTMPAGVLPADLDFSHVGHRDLSCTACHSSRNDHGRISVADFGDCQSCHHSPAVSTDCVSCHEREETNALSFEVRRTLDIRIGSLQNPVRTLSFTHAGHEGVACTVCHTGESFAVPATSNCSTCHFEHHEPTANCSGCHERPADVAHDRNAHLGCGGTGCHERVPAAIEWAPRTRELCLACHTTYGDHMPGSECASCHILPPPGGPARKE
jgi:hypothetical protein